MVMVGGLLYFLCKMDCQLQRKCLFTTATNPNVKLHTPALYWRNLTADFNKRHVDFIHFDLK